MRALLARALFVATILVACEPAPPSPATTVRAYVDAWQRGQYDAMYALLTPAAKAKIAKDAFVKRYEGIAAEMTLLGVDVTAGDPVADLDARGKPVDGHDSAALTARFRTSLVGELTRAVSLPLVRQEDKTWAVDWTPTAVLPELTGDRLVRMTRLDPTRGRILARDGTELATFGDGVEVGVVPGQIRDEASMLQSLAPLVGLSEAEVKRRYASGQPDWFMPIRTLAPSTTPDVRQKLALIEGVQLRPARVRSYPLGSLAAHVIGYVGDISADELAKLGSKGYRGGDRLGKVGLEAQLEDVLLGTFGWRLGVVEQDERQAAVLAEVPQQPGADVVLSLDVAVQKAAEAALAAEQKGAVVVEDPATGEILAIASQPSFDPNAFASGDSAIVAGYAADARRPLFNRATFGQYPTGSSFKLVTASAALREGALGPTEKVSCPYIWTGYGPQWVQVNHETVDLGLIDLRTALARSCNTFFYELGKRLNDKDPHLLPDTATSFGLGKATDIDFVLEAEGIVPSPEWKAKTFASDPSNAVWLPGDATNLAIGQGYLLVTPLQMVNYVSAVLNDGTVQRPRLVLRFAKRDGTVTKTFEHDTLRVASARPADLALVRDGMRAVVADPNGTAYYAFLGFSVDALGKSGTAETTPGAPDAWFIGGAPYGKPTVAIAALVDEKPGSLGSVDTARIARRTLAAALHVAP